MSTIQCPRLQKENAKIKYIYIYISFVTKTNTFILVFINYQISYEIRYVTRDERRNGRVMSHAI